MEQSALYYSEINAICMIILAILAGTQYSHSKANTTETLFLRKLIATEIIYSMSDIGAWIVNGHIFPFSKFLLSASNIVFITIPCVYSFIWVDFLLFKISANTGKTHKHHFLYYIPLIITSLAIASTPITNFAFSIDEANVYHREMGAYIGPAVCYGYLLYSLIILTIYIRKENNIVKKEEMQPFFYFYIPIAASGVLQLFIYGITVSTVGFTISIIMIFLNLQYNKISLDELTGLNNRHELKQYLNNIINSQNETLFICMIDVDYFKKINDTYGHVEGDIALKRVAQILKKVCSLHTQRLFLSRYGGDEFVISGVNLETEELDKLLVDIETVCSEFNASSEKPYKIMLSAGYSVKKLSELSRIEDIIVAADECMYEVKQERKKRMATASVEQLRKS